MAETFADAFQAAGAWAERARADGWLRDADVERIAAVERATPADLFAEGATRPLVIAFFGGTGVGKSSLLNRLAGEAIARTGVERPTSYEVTLCAHQSVALDRLAEHFDIERVRVERHHNDRRRDVLWVDMPDIDSTRTENRELALAWLAHIDLLVYVVSPERYRDDVGWRVLRERGGRHGWMFVMNHWDEGDPSQAEDFDRLLREAGFDDPLLLRTSCRQPTDAEASDEFAVLEESISDLLAAHGLRELERLGHRARLHELRVAVLDAAAKFGSDEDWSRLSAAWTETWQRTRTSLLDGLDWSLRTLAARFAVREGNLASALTGKAAKIARQAMLGRAGGDERATAEADESEATGLDQLVRGVWDDWAATKLGDGLDGLEVEAGRAGIAGAPVRAIMESVGGDSESVILLRVGDELRQALARPGTVLQRAARHVTGFAMVALPAMALLWVTHQVVTGYWRGSTGAAPFLGTPFAVHSTLLVLVAWLVPFVADRMLRPSLEQTALRGLRAGVESGLDALGIKFAAALERAGEQRAEHVAAGRGVANDISKLAIRPVNAGERAVARLLSGARS